MPTNLMGVVSVDIVLGAVRALAMENVAMGFGAVVLVGIAALALGRRLSSNNA